MTLIVLTVVVIALLIATLAIFLFRIGRLLNSTAGDLDDCAQNVKKISYQAGVIGPGVVRINETGTKMLGALPLLCDDAESVAVATGSPYVDPSEASYSGPSATPSPVTHEAPSPVISETPSPVAREDPYGAHAAVPATSSQRVGYQDSDEFRGNFGYMDT
jgi:hypothetical protein